MLSKMKERGNRATTKLKNAGSSIATKVNSGHRSRKHQRVRKCVLDLLQLYDPEKVDNVDTLMDEWSNPMELLQHLHQEYHLTDVGLTYFKSKYSRLFELPSIYKGTFCRQCIRRSNGEQRLYHRLYKKRVSPYTIKQIKYSISILRKLNNSPNIIKLYDIFESRTRLVLITDLFDYSKVNLPICLLKKGSILSEHVIANLFQQMLEIIAYIHSKQYIHCNLNIDSFIINNFALNDEQKTENECYGQLKLIRVDQCIFMPDITKKTEPFSVTNQRYAAPEIVQFDKAQICEQSDMWSLGNILYVMLTGTCECLLNTTSRFALYAMHVKIGMLPKQIPMIRCSNKQTVETTYSLQFDHDKSAWNHLSFAAKDLITKLIQKDADKRLSITECLNHPWIRRYNAGYLKYNRMHSKYTANLKKYQCVQKMRSGIKTLLMIKDCLGMMNDYILINDARAVVCNWSHSFEMESKYEVIVPSHIKRLIVDFA